MNWRFLLAISKSRNATPFSAIVTIPVLLTFKSDVLSSSQSLSGVFHRNRETLIRTSLIKGLCAFTRGKHHFCPSVWAWIQQGAKPTGLEEPGDGHKKEMGRGSGHSLHCLWSASLPALPAGRPDLDWYLGEEGWGECMKRNQKLIKIPQHILSLIFFFFPFQRVFTNYVYH